MRQIPHGARSASLALALILAAGCSGGGSNVAPGAKPLTGTPGAASIAKGKPVLVKLSIPKAMRQKRTIHTLGKHREFVSGFTQGIGIETNLVTMAAGSETPETTPIDSQAFSTNSDNPNCGPDPVTVGNELCTFTVNAVAPTTQFVVSAYDAEPATPTGGLADTFAATANLLSSSTSFQQITAGTNNPVTIYLGGAAASVALTTSGFPNLGNASVMSVTGNGAPFSATFTYAATDADGYSISAGLNDPLATPITFTLAEAATLPGHTTLTLNTMDSGGNPTTESTGPSQPTVTSLYSSDTLTLTYDGAPPGGGSNSADYYAQVTTASTQYTDPITSVTTPSFSETLTLAPLFVNFVPAQATGGKGDVVAGNATTNPGLFDESLPASMPLVVSAFATSTQPNVAAAVQPGQAFDDQDGGSPCTAFSVSNTGGTDFTATGAGGGTCEFTFGDGTGTQQNVFLIANGGPYFSPGPPLGITCNLTTCTQPLTVTTYPSTDTASVACTSSPSLTCSGTPTTPQCSDAGGDDIVMQPGMTTGAYTVSVTQASSPSFSCTFTFTDTSTMSTAAYEVDVNAAAPAMVKRSR
jgi:hypothetical protein